MRPLLNYMTLLFIISLQAQVNYGTPKEGELPEKLKNIPVGIEVMQFPKENHPVKIKDTYYWKHATGFISNEAELTITEFGAYLYYNNQWNLRKIYDLKDLDKYFGTKKQIALQAHPYVWTENWRTGDQLFGGWALWYFIGNDSNGKTVCGYATIHTTDQLLNK
ncbi:MAG: hypothetical protein AAGH46_02240 [Bacteroidota bacterium]